MSQGITDQADQADQALDPVTVSLQQLNDSTVPFETLEQAFGPSSLGILIVDGLPEEYLILRHRLLSYASYLANLPSDELESLSSPSSGYLIGWSHGKETLKSGSYDTLKGSYYVNCSFYPKSTVENSTSLNVPELSGYTGANIWPREILLPGFRQTFEALCILIIDVATLVARTCDRYAAAYIDGYESGYIENIVKTSTTTKARLLHYFPPEISKYLTSTHERLEPINNVQEAQEEIDVIQNRDSWCAAHVDHGCLTGLTSALYIDESVNPPCFSDLYKNLFLTPTPYLPSPPSASTGLYIHARTSKITQVKIPSHCLAFQTGEALELITRGFFRAVPHFVCIGDGEDGKRIARNTLAVFTQPELNVVVKENGTTFGELCQEVANRF